jgi:hypothetical protein
VRGRPVTLIADVASALTGATPTGTVTFQDDGTTIPGCVTQPLHEGQATCAVTYDSVSAHAITAEYSGDGRDSGSLAPAITLKVVG